MTLALGSIASVAAVERVPADVARALGTVRGKPVSTGLVFIDGKYLKPPYRVMRVGNQIQINDRPVTGQLIAWEKFLETQPPSNVKEKEVEVPETAPAAKPVPEKDGVDPAAPKDGGNAPPAPAPAPAPADDDDDLFAEARVRIVETRYAAGADDLDDFKPDASGKMKLTDIPADSAEDKARQKRAEDEKKEEETEEKEETQETASADAAAVSGKDENGDDVDPASPEGEALAQAKAAAAKKPAPGMKLCKVRVLDGKFEMNFQAQGRLKKIDKYRAALEATLRRGGYLFFGTGPRRYFVGRTSDATMANEILKKLPDLMGRADDCDAFCDAVRNAGLMAYINTQIAQDLFRHKVDAIYLKQRRRELAESDKIRRMVRGR